MNVIYIVSDLRPVGPTNQAYNLITGLMRFNCSAMIVTLFDEPDDSWIGRFRASGIKIVQLHSDRKHLKCAARIIDQIIIQSQINVVHSSGLSADTTNRFIKSKVYKITTIRQEFNEIAEERNNIIKFISRIITKANYKAMNLRVACSHILAKDVQKATGYEIRSVENGVDIDRFVPVSLDDKIQLRAKLGLPFDKTIYISIGVFYKRKQMFELVQSFLSIESDSAVLLLVGNGETFDQVNDLASRHENIILAGKQSDPLPYYQASDIFISAALAEGLPNTVLEAMACGLPCVLSDIGPHKEILEYNKNAGAFFRTADYSDIKKVLTDSLDWDVKSKSSEAITLININLSKYIMASNYYNLYKQFNTVH